MHPLAILTEYLDCKRRLLQRNTEHTLRNLDNFTIPFPRTEQFKKSPLYFLPKHWNDLPNEDKAQTNRFTFQSQIKNSLFQKIADSLDML